MTRVALACPLACALACAFACAGPPAPGAPGPRVVLVNRMGAVVDAIYLSPHDASSWEENVLGKDKLANGSAVTIRFGGREVPDRWDLRADGGGRRFHAEWTGLDVRAIATITLRVRGRAAVAELEPVTRTGTPNAPARQFHGAARSQRPPGRVTGAVSASRVFVPLLLR